MAAEARIKLSVDGASAAVTNISSVSNSLGWLADKAKDFQGLFAGLLGGLTVGALTAQVKGIIDAADSMNDLSQQVGIGVQRLGKYQLATAQSGTTMEAMAKGIKALSVNMAEHSDELRKAGITATDADGAMLQLADVFAGMPDGIEKTALASKLFGKSGMELIPMLNLGSSGLQESAEKSAKFAATLELLAPQADRFNDQMAELGLHTKVGSMAIVNEAMPAMISITAAMAAAAQEGGLLTAMWVGLGGAMHEFVAKPFQVLFFGIMNTIDEANASLMLFFRQTGEADKLYAQVARRNKEILALTTENAAPAPAGVKTVDAKKWTADYKALMDALGGAKGNARKAASEFEKLAKSGTELAASLIDIGGGLSGDFAKKWESLGAAYQSGAIKLDRLVLAQKKLLEQQPAMVAELKTATKAAEDRQTASLKEAAGIEAFMLAQQEAANASIKSVTDRIASLQAEEEAVAISQRQNISLAAAVDMVAIARLKEDQARKFVDGSEGWEAIQREIDKRQELLGLMNTKDLREREQSDWLAFYNSLDSTAQSTWTNVLEGGQGIWTKLRNTAKSVFFDWLYQMTAKKWLFNLTVSASGGALPASAGAGSIGGTSGLGNFTTLAGVGSSFGAGIGAGFGSLMGEAGIMGGLDAGLIAMQAGNIAGGLGTLAGVLGPIALGLGAVYALAKNLDHSGTPHTGGGSQYSAAGGLQTTANAAFNGGFTGVGASQSTIDMTSGIVQSVVSILDSTATAFGKTAGYTAATSFADDSSKDGSWGSLVISKLGDVMVNWADSQTSKWAPKVFADGSAGSEQYLAAITADVRKALDGIGLPGWAAQMLDKLGAAPGLDQLAATVAEINKTQTALAQMGRVLTGFGTLSDGAVQALIKAAGGIDSLATAASTYYDNFYTEAEKAAATTASVSDALGAVGLAMPATREAFRALVEGQQALGEAGAPALAALLKVSGAFASVVPATENVTDAANDLTTALGRTAQSIAAEKQSLQDQYDLLAGLTTQRQLERREIDASNLALFDNITTLQASKAAADALKESERALAAERSSLMDQLWQATNNTAAIRAKQLAGLDPSNRPIQQALYDIADAQTAFGALQSAVQTEKDRLTRQFETDKAALQEQAQADTSALKDALDAQQDAIQAELKAKQDGYAAQISAAEAARNDIAAIASNLANAVKAVKVESDAYDLARLQSARSLIAGAAASGNIKATGLDDALGIAAQDSKRFYSTFEDYAFEQARTAGDIARLNDAAQSQLSGFDQTILALKAQDDLAKTLADAQLAAAKAQYDLDVASAQTAAAAAAESNAAQLAALQAQYDADMAALDKTVSEAQKQLNALLGIDASVQTVAQAVNAFGSAVMTAMAQVAAVQASAAISAAQSTAAAATAVAAPIASEVVQSSSAVDAELRVVTGPPPVKAGMYGFDVGTNYVPYDMVAQIHEGEAIVPKAYNPAAGAQSNKELVAEIQALRAELAAQNRAIAENTRDTAKIMRRWHGDGMPETRTVT